MEIRQLEYFREIAATGSINEAARRLNMSQPPLSYQMKQLETELKVKLFERNRTGVTLTKAGKLLYERTESLLTFVHSTEQEVAKAGKKEVLRIGITPTTVSTVMPCISSFSRQNPDVNFEVRDAITFTLFNYLMEGIIDVSVVRTPINLGNVEFIEICREPMIAVFPPGIRTEEKEFTLEKLAGFPLILYRRYEKFIMDAFFERELEPDIFCVCDDPRDAMLWVKEGLAAAVFPRSMSSMCSGLKIKMLEEKELETRILLIWKKGKKPSELLQKFLDVCACVIRENNSPQQICTTEAREDGKQEGKSCAI